MSSQEGGHVWRRLKLVGQPYWLGSMEWTTRRVTLAILATAATVVGLTLSVSYTANFIVASFAKLDPAEAMHYFEVAGPYVLALAACAIVKMGFTIWKKQRQPLHIPDDGDPSGTRAGAWALLATVLLFMFAVNVLNVVINKISGTFTTALGEKHATVYWAYMYLYASIFVVGLPIVVYNAYFRKLLYIFWRRWLTHWLLGMFLDDERAFHRINSLPYIDNPDERIHQDPQNFVEGALSLLLTLLGALISLVSFFGILWSIKESLTYAVIGYAAFGTLVTVVIGRIMVSINSFQLRYEAETRFGITHVRNNAESIAFYNGQKREQAQIREGFRYVFWNYVRLLGAQRDLQFFTQGFDYAVVIIPAIFLAPAYFNGDIKLGVITQATMAFRIILHSLAVIVDAFPAMTLFAANLQRLATFVEALKEPAVQPGEEQISLKLGDAVELKNVKLRIPGTEQILLDNLNLTLEPNKPVIIVGPSGCGKSTIVRAIAGLWPYGSGEIELPVLPNGGASGSDMMFLPQNPYMVRGQLRDQVTYPALNANVSDDELRTVLETVNLAGLDQRFKNGFDEYRLLWKDVLSQGQQQRLAFARLLLTKPKIAILDEATSALDPKNEAHLYKLLRERETTYISIGHRLSLVKYHHYVLELKGDGTWEMMLSQEYLRRQIELE